MSCAGGGENTGLRRDWTVDLCRQVRVVFVLRVGSPGFRVLLM